MEMKDLSMHGDDLSRFDVFSDNQKEDEEIWFETASQHHQNNNTFNNNNNNNNDNDNCINSNNNNNINNINNDNSNNDENDPSSLFYAEFPALPDFPCKSSSSSSSSNKVVSKPRTTTTSSSASTASSGTASWAMFKSDAEQPGLVLDDVENCMDVLDDFGCMDLLDQSSDICWDPSPLFEDEPQQSHHHPEPANQVPDDDEEHVFRQFMMQGECNNDSGNGNGNGNFSSSSCVDFGQSSGGVQNESSSSAVADELAVVFFEWLKSNKETVSAEDLRNIKIKKSTIESAAKRLGGGKEGMKQLLKLILQWVQNHHLHTNPNPSTGGNCMNPSSWITPPPGPFCPEVGQMVPGLTPMMGDNPYGNGHPYPIPGSDYQQWAPPTGQMQYGVGPYVPGTYPDPGFSGYGVGYPAGYYYHPGSPCEGLVKMGSSATKEARKKRMARQRRFFTHHQRTHQSHHGINNNQHNPMVEMNGVGNVNCGVVAPNPGHANWLYWSHHHQLPPVPPSITIPGPGSIVGQMAPLQDRVGVSGFPRQVCEKKQGWKPEKNLRFLLQKVLKQSDVGNLGRIVLPKKEAEMHLPELEARDGIPIAMEDIGTSRVWNMRYRFWPNNKSRMYLLENTGDFVKSNGLQEGDFIVIYSDVKCGKYMIRGVKVRPQQGTKPETTIKTNKPSKTQKTQGGTSTAAGIGSSSSLNIMQ